MTSNSTLEHGGLDERSLKAIRILRGTFQRKIVKCGNDNAIPGSKEKIELLTKRFSLGSELFLKGFDPDMPIGKGWRITVGANGRVIEKTLTDSVIAGIFSRCPHCATLQKVRDGANKCAECCKTFTIEV